MDCFKGKFSFLSYWIISNVFLHLYFLDFDKSSYATHTQCMTELERYSGKDYVPKANQNKGQRKQEAWVDMVRGITDAKTNLSKGVKDILTQISSYDNIPRKKAKFLNFMKNSFRYMKLNDLEEAWVLLEEAMKENKSSQNGNSVEANGKPQQNGNKRKLEEKEDSADEKESEPKKKKLKEATESVEAQNGISLESEVSTTSTESKFKWQDAIKNILSAKQNEIKLKKLKKKVLKQYQNFTGLSTISDKFEVKFNKKMAKIKGVVVENDRVRLIEA